MEKIISITDLPEKEFLTRTRQGHKIYLLPNSMKYKEFNINDLSSTEYPYNKELLLTLKQQLEEQSSMFAFPKSLVMDEKHLYGYIGEYAKGTDISNIDEHLNLSAIMPQIMCLEKEVELLSRKGWVLDDIHENNMIVDRNANIKVIDTDYYMKHSKYIYEEILRQNRAALATTIINSIIPYIGISSILNNKKFYQLYILAINGQVNISELLGELITHFSRRNNIDSIESLRKTIHL